MPQRMVMDKLVRLTLVRKGKATAKHPHNRKEVIEVVKSVDATDDTPASEGTPNLDRTRWQ